MKLDQPSRCGTAEPDHQARRPDNPLDKIALRCGVLFTKGYGTTRGVCPLHHHGRIGADARLLLDEASAAPRTARVKGSARSSGTADAIHDRLRPAALTQPARDAFTAALSSIDGHQAVVGVQVSASWAARWAWRSAPPSSGRKPRAQGQMPYVVVTAAGGADAGRRPQASCRSPRATVATRMLKTAPASPTSWC